MAEHAKKYANKVGTMHKTKGQHSGYEATILKNE